MSAKQIRELGSGEIPASLYPEGWLEWATEPERRVNLNRCSVCVDSRNLGNWGRSCLFIVNGTEYVGRGMAYRNAYSKHRVNGRPVRVYEGREPDYEPIPF